MRSWDAADGLVQSVGHDDLSATPRSAIHSSPVDCAQPLAQVLQRLGANTSPNDCVGRTDAAMARATESIAGWLSYLPVQCVRTMVKDGWHWST